MITPTFTVSIDRTSLALAPLVIEGEHDNTTGNLIALSYQEPAMRQDITYAPGSAYVHGDVALGSKLGQALLQFDVTTDRAESEAAARAAIAELRVALNQWAYDVTVTVNGVAETWRCDPGSMGASERTYVNLVHFNAAYPVSIPCYPVRS